MPHARSQEAEWWFEAVYDAVQKVPVGKVTSYGHIAKLLGEPQRARQVGVCLKHLPSQSSRQRYHNGNVPWQRIVNSRGLISPRGPGSAQRQATALGRERVRVSRNAMGEFTVDFGVYGWFPEELEEEGWGEDGGEGEGGDGSQVGQEGREEEGVAEDEGEGVAEDEGGGQSEGQGLGRRQRGGAGEEMRDADIRGRRGRRRN